MVLSRISSLAILCILLFTAVFLTYSRKTISELNYDNHFYTVIWLLGIHALLFIISISMVWGIEDLVISVFITQIVFGISSLSSTLDFIVVWNDGFILDTPRAPVETPNAIQTETSKESITDFLAITLGCLSILTLVHGFRVLGEETVLMVFVGCAVVFGVIWGSAELLRGISERRKMLVGLGAMGIIGFVPRIVHGVLVEANMSNLFISTIITLSLTLSIYYHFIYSNRSLVFHFQYEAHETIITKFIVIHSIILIAMIRISYGYWANEELEVIIFSQLAFFLLPLTSSIDFWMMWEDAAVLENEKTKVTVRKTLKRVVKKTVVKLRPPKVTCFSCHQGYDEDRRTPRILKECGHTICEQCVNNLLAKNHWKHLFCPKCRMVTVVKGTANTLMKNFLALELVEEAGRVVERYRMDVLIQTGVIGFLATLPTIGMFLDKLQIICYGIFICVPVFCTCLYYYSSEIQQSTDGNVYTHRYLIAIWLTFQAFLLTVRLYKEGSDVPEGMRNLHKLSQGAFSVVSALSSLDFLLAWFTNTDEFPKKENQKVVVVNGVGEIEVEEVVYENEPRIECNVCYIGYSNFQNIPRILKECGHTICENCANQLLNRYNKVYLMCPFCQMITVVNGAANLLKKNQAVLDVVEDLRKQKS
ncbi:unnamed protein product [Caenorhabditis brenneri]